MNVQVKKFVFNAFQVNTYVVYDQSGECAVIDAACSNNQEAHKLQAFIEDHHLKPVCLLTTHTHVDHILGNPFVADTFALSLSGHADATVYLESATQLAAAYGLPLSRVEPVKTYLHEGDVVKFGNTKLQVFHTPGHALGSLCFYCAEAGFVITGDVLFNQSIGRTDLPGGDYEQLKKSIWSKLFVMPDHTLVYPGHGPETTIGSEKVNNPFVAIG